MKNRHEIMKRGKRVRTVQAIRLVRTAIHRITMAKGYRNHLAHRLITVQRQDGNRVTPRVDRQGTIVCITS